MYIKIEGGWDLLTPIQAPDLLTTQIGKVLSPHETSKLCSWIYVHTGQEMSSLCAQIVTSICQCSQIHLQVEKSALPQCVYVGQSQAASKACKQGVSLSNKQTDAPGIGTNPNYCISRLKSHWKERSYSAAR